MAFVLVAMHSIQADNLSFRRWEVDCEAQGHKVVHDGTMFRCVAKKGLTVYSTWPGGR